MKKVFEAALTKAIREAGLGIDKQFLKKAMDRVYHAKRKEGIDDTNIIWDLSNLQEALQNYTGDKNIVAHVPKVTPPKEIKLKEWTPGSEKFDPKLFKPKLTGEGIDMVLSDGGGIMLGTSYIIIGEAGVGKTTVASAIQASLQKKYKNEKIACVQSEMKRIDLGYEYQNKKWMKDLKYQILKDYGYENIEQVLIKIFTSGYDVLFVDSIQDITDKLKSYAGMSQTEAENFLLQLFSNANDGVDNHGKHTIIFAIQQVTKGGEYKGSTKLKHMTTGMMEMRFDEDGKRYIEFAKNRRCGKHVYKRLYYSLKKNEVVYDTETFLEVDVQTENVVETKDNIKKTTQAFLERVKKKSTLSDTRDASQFIDAVAEKVLS